MQVKPRCRCRRRKSPRVKVCRIASLRFHCQLGVGVWWGVCCSQYSVPTGRSRLLELVGLMVFGRSLAQGWQGEWNELFFRSLLVRWSNDSTEKANFESWFEAVNSEILFFALLVERQWIGNGWKCFAEWAYESLSNLVSRFRKRQWPRKCWVLNWDD